MKQNLALTIIEIIVFISIIAAWIIPLLPKSEPEPNPGSLILKAPSVVWLIPVAAKQKS